MLSLVEASSMAEDVWCGCSPARDRERTRGWVDLEAKRAWMELGDELDREVAGDRGGLGWLRAGWWRKLRLVGWIGRNPEEGGGWSAGGSRGMDGTRA